MRDRGRRGEPLPGPGWEEGLVLCDGGWVVSERGPGISRNKRCARGVGNRRRDRESGAKCRLEGERRGMFVGITSRSWDGLHTGKVR